MCFNRTSHCAFHQENIHLVHTRRSNASARGALTELSSKAPPSPPPKNVHVVRRGAVDGRINPISLLCQVPREQSLGAEMERPPVSGERERAIRTQGTAQAAPSTPAAVPGRPQHTAAPGPAAPGRPKAQADTSEPAGNVSSCSLFMDSPAAPLDDAHAIRGGGWTQEVSTEGAEAERGLASALAIPSWRWSGRKARDPPPQTVVTGERCRQQ